MRILLTLAATLITVPASAETVSGTASVIDGDTLQLGERRIRLFGIDAPEAQQTCDRRGEVWACGEESSSELRELIGAAPVTCTGDEIDQYDRLVAVCSAGYLELNKAMVSEGWATAYRKYSKAYVPDETRAASGRRGLWASDFVLPESYRAARTEGSQSQVRPERQTSARPASTSCTIKGNHSRRGEWIYHLPGMPYYEQTRAEEMFARKPRHKRQATVAPGQDSREAEEERSGAVYRLRLTAHLAASSLSAQEPTGCSWLSRQAHKRSIAATHRERTAFQ